MGSAKRRKRQTVSAGKRTPSADGEGRGRTAFAPLALLGIVVLMIVFAAALHAYRDAVFAWFGSKPIETRSSFALEEIPFDGATALDFVEKLCAIGPRPSGSEGMSEQQDLLEAHLRDCGALVHRQEFTAPDPRGGPPVAMTNLVAQFEPGRTERILLCAHYDTLPYPMLDPVDPQGTFVGANDGASGVAILMVLAAELPDLLATEQTDFGVDIVLLDGEEYIFEPDGRYFLGSEHFAEAYRDGRLPYAGRYRWGVLLDMVGDADLQLPIEANSGWWPDTRPLVDSIWSTARRLGVYEFIPRRKYEIRDDHIMLRNVGGIPTCDIIDFDYPVWHTTGDTPAACSAVSLAKVGWVVREWLRTVRPDA